VTYPVEIPDHPLVAQTMRDCLTEAADVRGLEALLGRIEAGDVRMHCLDTVEPTPFSHEVLNARPYAFLDDAPLEERRTRAVSLRHSLPDDARDLARLDADAIARVREEAAPEARSADELHELLCDWIVARAQDLPSDEAAIDALVADGRAARVATPDGARLFASEKVAEVRVLFPDAVIAPVPVLPPALAGRTSEFESALDAAVRGHLALLGPATAAELATRIGVAAGAIESSLARLEGRGIAVRGRFEAKRDVEQFCDRSLLARIHRYTLARLRREIEPVSAQVFLRFLLGWQHLAAGTRLVGEGGLLAALERLSGFEAAAAAWEDALLPARIEGYKPQLLDSLCLAGAAAWGRVSPAPAEPGTQPSRLTPIGVFPRADLEALLHFSRAQPTEPIALRGPAERVLELLRARGALFASEIDVASRLLPVQVEEGLRELIAHGLVSCDGFAPLRRLLGGGARARERRRPGRNRVLPRGLATPEGRWNLLIAHGEPADPDDLAEATAWRLLHRYGVIFRDLLAREYLPDRWRPVHSALRRLEARGLVRGGRFVTGFTGEQFALPEAIGPLRRMRAKAEEGAILRVSAADPLNLVGILTPGARVPAGHTRWVIFRDGLPIAVEDRDGRTELAAVS
jgi:ATP-dependent Lhr-like helicase